MRRYFPVVVDVEPGTDPPIIEDLVRLDARIYQVTDVRRAGSDRWRLCLGPFDLRHMTRFAITWEIDRYLVGESARTYEWSRPRVQERHDPRSDGEGEHQGSERGHDLMLPPGEVDDHPEPASPHQVGEMLGAAELLVEGLRFLVDSETLIAAALEHHGLERFGTPAGDLAQALIDHVFSSSGR